jgi:transcriptional regulator of NAD metabolism
MEKISWTDRVKNCLLKHVIEGKIEGSLEVTRRRGRRSKKLLDNLREEREYWKLKGGKKH